LKNFGLPDLHGLAGKRGVWLDPEVSTRQNSYELDQAFIEHAKLHGTLNHHRRVAERFV